MTTFHVTGIGNANIDIVDQIDQHFLGRFGMKKSHCVYIDRPRLAEMKAALPHHKLISGGAVANTIHCLRALGLDVSFQGIVVDDAEGRLFKKDLSENNIGDFVHVVDDHEIGTTQIFCLITEDGDRSFASYDGIARSLEFKHLNINAIQDSSITYFDGYTLYSPHAHDAFEKASHIAHDHGNLIAFNPADLSIIQTFPDPIKSLCGMSDILLCNLVEATAIYGFKTLDECAAHLPHIKYAGAVTNGSHGAMIFRDGDHILIPTTLNNCKPLDTNGAGDHFAAGILYGLLNNLSLSHMANLAHLCSVDCIGHTGARPLTSLSHLIDESRKIAA